MNDMLINLSYCRILGSTRKFVYFLNISREVIFRFIQHLTSAMQHVNDLIDRLMFVKRIYTLIIVDEAYFYLNLITIFIFK